MILTLCTAVNKRGMQDSYCEKVLHGSVVFLHVIQAEALTVFQTNFARIFVQWAFLENRNGISFWCTEAANKVKSLRLLTVLHGWLQGHLAGNQKVPGNNDRMHCTQSTIISYFCFLKTVKWFQNNLKW